MQEPMTSKSKDFAPAVLKLTVETHLSTTQSASVTHGKLFMCSSKAVCDPLDIVL